jgi:hypothetical protein
MTKGPRPHYFPAGLIGGFGVAGQGADGLRSARVCVRWTVGSRDVSVMRADRVGFQYGIYDVDQPGPDLAADFAEQLWKQYEGSLPAAVKALDNGSWMPSDWHTILLHVQAQAIRHPDFDRVARDYVRGLDGPELSGDDVQAQRQRTYQETRGWMAQARFALVRQCHPAPRFMVNDKGYTPLADPAREVKGVLFPLSGHVGVIMAVGAAQPGDDYETGPFAERILRAGTVTTVNEAALGTVGIRCVIGHPDDRDAIAAMTVGPKVAAMPQTGACLGTLEGGLFDWAWPVRQFAAER